MPGAEAAPVRSTAMACGSLGAGNRNTGATRCRPTRHEHELQCSSFARGIYICGWAAGRGAATCAFSHRARSSARPPASSPSIACSRGARLRCRGGGCHVTDGTRYMRTRYTGSHLLSIAASLLMTRAGGTVTSTSPGETSPKATQPYPHPAIAWKRRRLHKWGETRKRINSALHTQNARRGGKIPAKSFRHRPLREFGEGWGGGWGRRGVRRWLRVGKCGGKCGGSEATPDVEQLVPGHSGTARDGEGVHGGAV